MKPSPGKKYTNGSGYLLLASSECTKQRVCSYERYFTTSYRSASWLASSRMVLVTKRLGTPVSAVQPWCIKQAFINKTHSADTNMDTFTGVHGPMMWCKKIQTKHTHTYHKSNNNNNREKIQHRLCIAAARSTPTDPPASIGQDGSGFT